LFQQKQELVRVSLSLGSQAKGSSVLNKKKEKQLDQWSKIRGLVARVRVVACRGASKAKDESSANKTDAVPR